MNVSAMYYHDKYCENYPFIVMITRHYDRLNSTQLYLQVSILLIQVKFSKISAYTLRIGMI